MNDNASDRACNAICEYASEVKNRMLEAVSCYDNPSAIYKPALTVDGNQWCALYGIDLQSGVAGFGDSPYLAMKDFDNNWYAKLPAPPETKEEK